MHPSLLTEPRKRVPEPSTQRQGQNVGPRTPPPPTWTVSLDPPAHATTVNSLVQLLPAPGTWAHSQHPCLSPKLPPTSTHTLAGHLCPQPRNLQLRRTAPQQAVLAPPIRVMGRGLAVQPRRGSKLQGGRHPGAAPDRWRVQLAAI